MTNQQDIDEEIERLKQATIEQIGWIRENLTYARTQRGPAGSAERIAVWSGIGIRTIQDYFTAKRKPDLDTVIGITHALGLRFQDVAKAPDEFRKTFPEG